jgi:transposase
MRASHTWPLIAEHNGTIFLAIELSLKGWLITLRSPERDRLSRYRMNGGDHAGLLKLIEDVRGRAARALGQVPAVVSCYEAGYDGFWLHRVLNATGITNFVFDAASVPVERRSRRAKTDRIDGELLLRTLMAHCRGEPRVVRVARVPSREAEDARRASRERDRLVKERTGHINRIKGLLRTVGLAAGNPRRRDWPRWLGEQRDPEGRAIGAGLRRELEHEHARLLLVGEQLAELEQEPAHCDEAAAPTAKQKIELQRLKSLGAAFAGTLVDEVFYKDFDNRRQVASYVGLAPSPWQSGGLDREQGNSKAGNPRARRAAIEMAWLWLRHQPGSALSRWFEQRTAGASKRQRRIAIVALARKLIVALWRYLTTGLVPEGAVMKA